MLITAASVLRYDLHRSADTAIAADPATQTRAAYVTAVSSSDKVFRCLDRAPSSLFALLTLIFSGCDQLTLVQVDEHAEPVGDVVLGGAPLRSSSKAEETLEKLCARFFHGDCAKGELSLVSKVSERPMTGTG